MDALPSHPHTYIFKTKKKHLKKVDMLTVCQGLEQGGIGLCLET